MNTFNLLMNFVIANSRANFYNVTGNQEITNTGLIAGMISDNPLMSYLIIDNKARIEGERANENLQLIKTATPVSSVPSLPPASTTAPTPPMDKGNQLPTGQTETSAESQIDTVVVFENFKVEIANNNKIFKDEIVLELKNIKNQLSTKNFEMIESKIAVLENNNTDLKRYISDIKLKLEEIIKVSQPQKDSLIAKPIDINIKEQTKLDK